VKPMARIATMTRSSGNGQNDTGRAATPSVSLRAKGTGAPATARIALLSALLAITALAAFASPALAIKSHAFASSVSTGDGSSPGGLAVDQTNGVLYVADHAGGGVVHKYDATGAPADFSALASPTLGTFSYNSNVAQLAVDASGGANNRHLYVTDSGNTAVRAFDATGAPAAFTASGPYITANALTGTPGGAFALPCGVAVDTSGLIYVGDYSAAAVDVFAPSGAYLTQIAVGFSVCEVAVDSLGNVYANNLGAGVYRFTPDALPITSATTYTGPTTVTDAATYGLAVDPADGTLYLNANGSLVHYDSAAAAIPNARLDSFGSAQLTAGSNSVAVDRSGGANEGSVYASLGNTQTGAPGTQADRFAPATFPTTTAEAADLIGGTTATLNGKVNPDGFQVTDCHFEYVSDKAFEATGFTDLSSGGSAPCAPDAATIPADSADHAVSANITGLQGNGVGYHFRLVAANAQGTELSAPLQFTTEPSAPLPVTGPGLTPGPSTVELTGTVNPEGLNTSFYFEYGTTAAYGTKAPASLDGVAGNGQVPVSVARPVSGLEPDTTYHYRLVAVNSAGTAQGEDKIFTTEAPPALGERAYEQVTPVEKGGIPPMDYLPESGIFRAAADGNAVRYTTVGATPGSQGAPFINTHMAKRTASGWENADTALPLDNLGVFATNFGTLVAVSDDVRHAAVISNRQLTPDATAGVWNLYRTDPFTGEKSLLASDNALGKLTDAAQYESLYIGASSDLRTVVYQSGGTMVAAIEGQSPQTVSVLPKGTTVDAFGYGGEITLKQRNQVSDDGTRVYWCTPDASGCRAWYLRSNVGQPQSALAPPPTATAELSAATGLGDLTQGSPVISNVTTSTGAFSVGQTIVFGGATPEEASEFDFLPHSTIAAVGPGTITLSSPAPSTSSGIELKAGSKVVTEFNPIQEGFTVAQEVFGPGIPSGTTIASIGSNTITLTRFPDASGVGVELTSIGGCTEPQKACTVMIPNSEHRALIGVTADGNRAEFASERSAVGRSTERYDAQSGDTTQLSEEPFSFGPLTGAPGRDEAYGLALANSALQRLHGGTVSTLAPTTIGNSAYTLSENERFIVFTSPASGLTTNPAPNFTGCGNGRCAELYLLDTVTDTLRCASCRRDEGPATGIPSIAADGRSEFTEHWWARSVLDDGTVYFDTADPLVAADVNGVRDVYSYKAGHLTLISPGVGPASEFKEVAPSGSDVYFTTKGRLVAQDTDDIVDLYDARVGGGIASQNVVPTPDCSGADCRTAAVPAPPTPTIGSRALSGPGDRSPRGKKPKKHHKPKHHAKKHRHSKQKRAGHNRGGAK
jgi:hypothetical protein